MENEVSQMPKRNDRRQLNIDRDDLDWAVSRKIIDDQQANTLWEGLWQRVGSDSGGFSVPGLLQYSGAALVMIAMAWFMGQSYTLFKESGLFMISVLYALAFTLGGQYLWKREGTKVAGGLLHTLAVFMVPFAAGSFLGMIKYNGDWRNGPIFVEAMTLMAGLATVSYVRFPFLMAPISISAWAVSLDVLHRLLPTLSWEEGRVFTMFFGLVMIASSYLVDRRSKEDFGFWGYLLGTAGFWVALSMAPTSTELGKLLYFGVNLLMMVASVLLGRRIFVIFGSMGSIYYLGHLTFSLFGDSPMFPMVLVFMGLGIIFLGVQYHKHRQRIEEYVLGLIPEWLQPWLPVAR